MFILIFLYFDIILLITTYFLFKLVFHISYEGWGGR